MLDKRQNYHYETDQRQFSRWLVRSRRMMKAGWLSTTKCLTRRVGDRTP
jgi:hypothetical protein